MTELFIQIQTYFIRKIIKPSLYSLNFHHLYQIRGGFMQATYRGTGTYRDRKRAIV